MREDGFDEEKSAVLIVDDNEINRMILCETFKGRDEILEAENGEEALALIRRNPGSISAVLLDIVMPKMDGLALLEILNPRRTDGDDSGFSDYSGHFGAEHAAGISAGSNGHY